MKLEVNAKLRIKHIDLYLKITLSTVVHVFTLQVLVQYAMEEASSTAHICDDVLVLIVLKKPKKKMYLYFLSDYVLVYST
jgi:hypothetical protein